MAEPWRWIDKEDDVHVLVDGEEFSPSARVILQCGNIESSFQDRIARIPVLEMIASELLEAYVEENGGDMPTNDDHPAHALRNLLGA